MVYTRQLGAMIQSLSTDSEVQESLCRELNLSKYDLQRLYVGRLLLTWRDLNKAASILDIPIESLINVNETVYESAMTDLFGRFTDPANREKIRDLIDDYLDVHDSLLDRKYTYECSN